MINSFIWLILASILILPALLAGNIPRGGAFVLLTGITLTAISEVFRRKTNWQYGFNLAVSLIWGILYFMIGFPNIRRPNGNMPASEILLLIFLALLPLLLVLIAKWLSFRKVNQAAGQR